MDKQKKMILAIAAIGVLGAGSYFFVLRGDDGPGKSFTKDTPTERKKSDKPAESKADKRKAPKETKTAEKAPSDRKEREEVEQTVSERKKKRQDKKEEKKKTIAPAA